MTTADLLLLDYRRRVSEIYAALRADISPPEIRWQAHIAAREALISTHPRSALDAQQQARFPGLPYFPYDPALRFEIQLHHDIEPKTIPVPLQGDGLFSMRRFAPADFAVEGQPCSLYLYWIEGYAGGVFLPFRDATCQTGETYGAGRYLIDSIKGADLGGSRDRLVLDFNYAYNPSCAYNSRWHCPLAPPENRLDMPIRAGEQAYPDPI
jgi:hypothetical protein